MEEKAKSKKSITWRITPETEENLIKTFGSVSGKEVPEAVFDVYFNQYPKLQKEIEDAKQNAAEGVPNEETERELEDARDRIKELESEVEGLNKDIDTKDEQYETDRNALRQQVEGLKSEIEALKAEDPTLISIYVKNEKVMAFLNAVKSHLEKEYSREVSFYEIFVMSTLLYNIEKRCDWFYPPLKDRKIEEVTGKTIKEWNRFLSQKESNN